MLNKNILITKVFMFFKIMKVRMKISYSAFVRNITVVELVYKSILKAYNERNCKGLINNPYPLNKE